MRKLRNEELDRKSLTEFKKASKLPLIIVLDNVRSMHNIGSVFRSSDAFLVERIMLCGITAVPPHKDIHKTALGATESVDWEYCEDTREVIENLKSEGYCIIGVEQAEDSVSLIDFSPDSENKYVFVLGHEVRGVQQEVMDLCDMSLEIPQFGTKHSLNISVCAGVLIWDFYQKLK